MSESNPEPAANTGAAARGASPFPPIRAVSLAAPLRWLAAGVSDLERAPLAGMAYGTAFALMGWLVWLVFRHAYQYTTALTAGFLLVGPFVCTGLYDISRRIERGQTVRLADTVAAWRANLGAFSLFALALTIIMLIWARASLVTFALFAVSVVSVPMMLDRGTDTVVAALTSVRALLANPGPLVLWALLIVLVIGMGFATLFIGLVVAAPVVGHATWHAYRDLVGPASDG